MKAEWEKLYRSALMERNSELKQLRIESAHKAVIWRIKQTTDIEEVRKLHRAMEVLSHLRDPV